MKPIAVKKVKVTPNIREVRFLVRGDPRDKNRVTGAAYRTMLDLHVETLYANKKEVKEVFTAHVYKDDIRVIVRKTSFRDSDLSLDLSDFEKYADRRWGKHAKRIVNAAKKVENL